MEARGNMVRPYTWLCPTQADRDRLLSTVNMVGGGRTALYVVLVAIAIAAAPTYGLLIVGLALVSGCGSAFLYRRLEARKRPEYWAAAAWLLTQAPVGVLIALTGGAASVAAPLLACGTISLVARFSRRGIVVGTAFLVVTLLLATVAPDPAAALQHRWNVAVAAVLIMSVEIFVMGMMRSEVAGRTHDRLTGLANESQFTDRLYDALARVRNPGLAVLAIDLDGFGVINDAVGAANGDELLRAASERIVDAAGRDAELVARRSGDEFLVLVRDREEIAGDDRSARGLAETVARRVQAALRAPFSLPGGADCPLSASVGVALLTGDDNSSPQQLVETLLSRAQSALSEAKASAPHGLSIFARDHSGSRARLMLLSDLRKAVARDELVLHYQPNVDLHTGELLGVEALLRWQHPLRGLVPPDQFIHEAEQSGCIEEIGAWVIDEACRQAREWEHAGLGIDVAFNLSARQLWDPTLLPTMLKTFLSAGVAPQRLVVEITESSALHDPERVLPLLHSIREQGVRLAIDDFGVGLSSLSRLQDIPAEILKIDRSFIANLDRSPDGGAIVRAIIQLADNLRMTPHAEGIELEGQREFLLANGCYQGQGFLFARAIPAADIPRFAHARLSASGVPLGDAERARHAA